MPPRKPTKIETKTPAKAAVKPVAKSSPVETSPLAPAPVAKSEVKGSGTTAKAVAAAPRVLTHDLIAKRAFEIYASRGYAPGNPDADWAEAERQLKAGL